jgi:hypothetical protein
VLDAALRDASGSHDNIALLWAMNALAVHASEVVRTLARPFGVEGPGGVLTAQLAREYVAWEDIASAVAQGPFAPSRRYA